MDDDEGDSDFLSDISSDDDVEFGLNEPRKKNENYLEHTVPQYSDNVFFEHFRLSKDTVNEITHRYENSMYYNNKIGGQYRNLPAVHQVLIYLWYIGHETASFRDVGDRFNVTISSVFRIIRRMTMFLSNLSPSVIEWPDDNEKSLIEEHFAANNFPGVIGAIDGCHIKIDKPDNDPESYINRKGYYSIQMQVVCDHNRKIRDIFVGFPGSVHDSRVFSNSPLKNSLTEKCNINYFILGDSGYPLQRTLLTPYKDRGNLTRRQMNYNTKLSKNRYVIEHCFEILKQKFRQLYHIKLRNIQFIVHFIRAACVLHNLALYDDFPFLEEPIPDDDDDEDEDEDDDNIAVLNAIRDRVANSLNM